MSRNYSETRLHICVAEWLQSACPFLLWTHPANQSRSPQEGAKLKRMGVLAGVSDLLFWHDGWFGAIELKTTSGMSDKQRNFKAMFELAGGKFAVCTSVKDVYDTLVLWGVKPLHMGWEEPKPPIQELYKAALEFNKRLN